MTISATPPIVSYEWLSEDTLNHTETPPVEPNPEPYRYTVVPCSLGYLLAAQNAQQELCAFFIGDSVAETERELHLTFSKRSFERADDILATWVQPLASAVDTGEWPDIPIAADCSPLHQRLWEALRNTPVGDQMTAYSALGHRVGQPNTLRAAAHAQAANRLATLVACDRIVATERGLARYRWHVDYSNGSPTPEGKHSTETKKT